MKAFRHWPTFMEKSREGHLMVTQKYSPNITIDETKIERKIFRRVIFINFWNDADIVTAQDVTSQLLTSPTLTGAIPNLAHLASIRLVLPVTTVSVEGSSSDMRLMKTRFRSTLSDDHAMRVCTEGPERLDDKGIVTHWKEQKPRDLLCNIIFDYILYYMTWGC